MDDIDGRGRSGPIVGVLRAARNAGFAVDLDGEKLRVTGPQARSDILDEIREHKAEISEAMPAIWRPMAPMSWAILASSIVCIVFLGFKAQITLALPSAASIYRTT